MLQNAVEGQVVFLAPISILSWQSRAMGKNVGQSVVRSAVQNGENWSTKTTIILKGAIVKATVTKNHLKNEDVEEHFISK